MVRTKVFIGNLSFKTREAELAQQFETVAKVVSVNIITRGPRSLGYGFVELESEEDAKKAVAAMDKKEIDGRPINVDLAKTRPEGEDNKPAGAEGSSPNPNASRQRPPRRPRADNNNNGAPAAGANPVTGSPAPEGSSPAGSRPPRRPRQPRPPRAQGEAGAAPATNADGTPAAAPARQPRAPRTRQPRQPKAEGEASGAPQQPREPRQPRQPRQPREPTDTSNREPSKTSLFVANLPFSLTNESFAKLLTDSGLKFKSAHVVTKRNQKSKGFGFVEFDAQDDQKKALETLTGKQVEDRELVPKVALIDPKRTEAPVPGSPAPAAAEAAKTN